MSLKLLLFMAVACILASAVSWGEDAKRKEDIARILLQKGVWGKDFANALASLPNWREAKETSVIVFPDRIVGGTPFTKEAEAKGKAESLSATLARARPQAVPKFNKLLESAPDKLQQAFKVQVTPFFVDDDSTRLALTPADAEKARPQFLRKGLSVNELQRLLGKPEKTRTEVIDSVRGERRPTILTLYEYAGGSVKFATSNFSPKPDIIDRAVLDVASVSAAIFNREEE